MGIDNKSLLSKIIFPESILPGGDAIRRKTLIEVTDFPQPDSPTNPNTSPLLIEKDTLSIA